MHPILSQELFLITDETTGEYLNLVMFLDKIGIQVMEYQSKFVQSATVVADKFTLMVNSLLNRTNPTP